MIDLTDKPTNIISTTSKEIIISYDRNKQDEVFDEVSPMWVSLLSFEGQEYFVQYAKAYHDPEQIKVHFNILEKNIMYIHLNTIYFNGKSYTAKNIKDNWKDTVIKIEPANKQDAEKELQFYKALFSKATHINNYTNPIKIKEIKGSVAGDIILTIFY